MDFRCADCYELPRGFPASIEDVMNGPRDLYSPHELRLEVAEPNILEGRLLEGLKKNGLAKFEY